MLMKLSLITTCTAAVRLNSSFSEERKNVPLPILSPNVWTVRDETSNKKYLVILIAVVIKNHSLKPYYFLFVLSTILVSKLF